MRLILWTVPLLSLFGFAHLTAEEPPEVSNPEAKTSTVRLQYRFAEGDEWHYSLTEKGTQTGISAGLTQTARNNSMQTKHYRVVQVDEDGSAVLEVVVDRYRIDFTVQLGESEEQQLVYDTAGDDPPPHGLEGVRKSIGKPYIRFRMSPSGDITELNFLQTNQQQQLKQTEQRKGLPIAFPKEPIEIGKSWSEKIEIELGRKPGLKQNYTVQTIYQLKAVEDSIAEISLNTIVQPRLTDPVLRGQVMQYLPTGSIRFDTERGRIVSRSEVVDRRELGVGGPKTVMIVDNTKEETLIEPGRPGRAN